MREDILSNLGLSFNPFSAATSIEGYFHTKDTDLTLQELFYGVENRKGFLMLVGDVGVGKTSLLLQLLQELEKNGINTAWIFNTLLDQKELLTAVARDFGLKPSAKANLSTLIDQLHQFFLKHNEQGSNCAIVIDEAHNLDNETLESLRMLSNLEANGQKLVQILLVGQTELKERLDEKPLRQLRSRINIYKELLPLDREETHRYVHFKLSIAGGHLRPTPAAMKHLYVCTRGNLRLINLVMERTLYGLVAYGGREVTKPIVTKAIEEVGECQNEIRRRHRKSKREIFLYRIAPALAGGISITIILVLMLGNFPQRKISREGAAQTSSQASASSPSRSQEDQREIINTFLSSANLEYLESTLLRAVDQNDWSFFAEKLPREYDLFITDRARQNSSLWHGVLPWKKMTGTHPGYLVLWKPEFRIKEYFPGYQGGEIRKLQEMLQSLNYYNNRIDGTVGQQTWRAINRFQKDMDLPQTGRPDAQTLFVLTDKYTSRDQDQGMTQ